MTKEEFERRDAELIAQIKGLTQERALLQSRYMAAATDCVIGDDVIITLDSGETHRAYIASLHAGNYFGHYKQDGISYHFMPITRKGTHSLRDFPFGMERVKSFELVRPVYDGGNEEECEAFENRC